MTLPRGEWKEIIKKVPSLVVDGVLIDNEKVLLIKRAHEPFKGMWATPGGFVEFGERPSEAIEREFLEETGIMSKASQLIGVYDDPKRDPRGHMISLVYLMKRKSGKMQVSDETLDVGFFHLRKLPKNMAFDSKSMVRDALKLLKKK